jgi:TolB-like protein/Flp pilus assembly protein TadD
VQFDRLFGELRRRSVFRALGGYAIVAWMLLQVADVTFDSLPIPAGAMTGLIILVIAGFPIVAVLAWAYEITHKGIVRQEEIDGRAPRLPILPFISVVALVAVLSGGLLYYLANTFWEAPRRSIAVLPFVNQSSEADTEYLSDGLTEEIQSLIVRINEFRVVALSTSYSLKDTPLDVVSIAKRVGADVILQGGVRRLENTVRVSARLIDGATGDELWSETYDRELADLFAIQEDIARQVARALHVVLPVSAKRRLANLGTSNVEAYDLYLRGLDYLRKPPDQVTVGQAQTYFRQSLALDKDFARAQAALCTSFLEMYRLSRDATSFGDAEQACQLARKRDANSSDVQIALGDLYQTSGKYELALHEYQAAIEKTPDSADAYIGLAAAYVGTGDKQKAEGALRQAIDLDVSYWASFNAMGNFLFDNGRYGEAAEFYEMFVNRADDDAMAINNLGAAYYLAGDFRKAAEAWDESLAIKPTAMAYSNTGSMYFYLGEFEKAADRYSRAVELTPRNFRVWGNLADAYYYSGQLRSAADIAYRRAIDFGEQQLTVNDADIDTLSDLAYYYVRIGEKEKSRELNARAVAAAPDNMYVQYNSALIHTTLGDMDEALGAVQSAIELGYQPELLRADPGLSKLRENKEFGELLALDAGSQQ